MPTTPRRPADRAAWPRVAGAVLLVGLLALLASSDVFHRWLSRVLETVSPIISDHPLVGASLFVLLSALSAMLAFFSSAVLVPVAVETFGEVAAVLLLWLGWILGGVWAYGLARVWGRPVIRRLISDEALAKYDARVSPNAPFGLVLLFQLAVPSELPGYLLGVAHYPFRRYLTAVALAEVPYAIGTVWLGVGVVERDLGVLLGVGAMAILLTALAIRALRKRTGAEGRPK